MSSLTGGAFLAPAAALAGQQIPGNPGTWPAYRALLRAVVGSVAHVPVVLLGVCTPQELAGWPIGAWILLDCADRERRRRLGRHLSPQRVADAIADARDYRTLGLPAIDTTGRTPDTAAAELAGYIQALEHDQQP